jgi:hypothetical protein
MTELEIQRQELALERQQEIREAVLETFFLLGVDVSSPEAIQEFRRDLVYVREWRVAVNDVKKHGLLTAVGIIIAGFFGWLVLSLKAGYAFGQ